MKKLAAITALLGCFCMFLFLACDRNEKQPDKPEFLVDAHNLAHQTGGFYAKVGQVTVEKGEENGQNKLHLTLSDGSIRPKEIKIFLEREDWEQVDLASGQYEILFLKNILIINDPMSAKKSEFVVTNDDLEEVLSKIPTGYISERKMATIGLSVIGQHGNTREHPDLVPGGCASSGGEGSSSCSNACCSITCNKGYDAHCLNTCYCSKSA